MCRTGDRIYDNVHMLQHYYKLPDNSIHRRRSVLGVGMNRGVPNPRFPPPYPHFPSRHPRFPRPRHPLPSPWNISLAPSKTNRSSHHITFRFSVWIIIKDQKTVGQFVCSSVICFFFCFFVFLEFYNLVNGPVDNIVVKSSRGGKDKGRQDR